METEPEQSSKPLLLTQDEMARIHHWVNNFLPPYYDRDYIADTIILNAWMKQIPHVSREYVRNKCISAWRVSKRERQKNENATRLGRTDTIEHRQEDEGIETVNRKILVQEAVGKLTPFERRIIWMRFYDDQTLEEIASQVTLRRDQVLSAIKVAVYKMRAFLT